MAVPDEMREVEREIDSRIDSLPAWSAQREKMLLIFLGYYKDSMREVSGLWMHGRLFENADSIRKAIAIEHHLHAGVFQCLKWTMEFADPNGAPGDLSPEELTALVDLGRSYEALVDCLKMGKHDRVVIQPAIVCRCWRMRRVYSLRMSEHDRFMARYHLSWPSPEYITYLIPNESHLSAFAPLREKSSHHQDNGTSILWSAFGFTVNR